MFKNFDRANMLPLVLKGDAIYSSICTLVLIFGAGWLEEVVGLDALVFVGIGISFIPFIGSLLYLSQQDPINRYGAWGIVIANISWVVLTIIFILIDPFDITTNGKWMILATSDGVLVLGLLQYLGIRWQPTLQTS